MVTSIFHKTTDAGPSRIKPGATAGLDPRRGSRVEAWSSVPLGQALLLLAGMLAPGASSSLTLGQRAGAPHGGGPRG